MFTSISESDGITSFVSQFDEPFQISSPPVLVLTHPANLKWLCWWEQKAMDRYYCHSVTTAILPSGMTGYQELSINGFRNIF